MMVFRWHLAGASQWDPDDTSACAVKDDAAYGIVLPETSLMARSEMTTDAVPDASTSNCTLAMAPSLFSGIAFDRSIVMVV